MTHQNPPLHRWRVKYNLSTSAAAALFGVSQREWQRWEAGDAPISGPARVLFEIAQTILGMKALKYTHAVLSSRRAEIPEK